MSQSKDKIAATIGSEEDLRNTANLGKRGVDHINVTRLKRFWENEREEKWSEVVNGNALSAMTKSEVKRDWIWEAKRIPSRKSTCREQSRRD